MMCLELRPGDGIVLCIDRPVTREMAEEIKSALKAVGITAAVIGGGLVDPGLIVQRAGQ